MITVAQLAHRLGVVLVEKRPKMSFIDSPIIRGNEDLAVKGLRNFLREHSITAIAEPNVYPDHIDLYG